MPRQTRQQIDDEIMDAAATLFARHGFQETSLQRIADAVGYSKGGLLRHYPSKEALQEAVVSHCLSELTGIARAAADHAPGPARDRTVLTGLAHLAFRRPGFLALLLSTLLRDPSDQESAALQPVENIIAEALALPPEPDPERAVRIAGALGALTVARIALRDRLSTVTVDHLIDVSFDALGHRVPAAR